MGPVLQRRDVLGGLAGLALSRSARADVDPGWRPTSLDVREVRLEGSLSRRMVLAVPRHLGPGERAPLVVLLHGLGETGDERAGAWAWLERYGLGTSYDRLRAASAMRGLVLACPYMPDLPIADPRALDDYAGWIAEVVVPRARAESPALPDPRFTYLGGCSLGGHFSLETLLRRPAAFGAWGGVQSAIGVAAAERYAARLAALPSLRAVLVETSTADPFRAGNEALAAALARAGRPGALVELPGPHDQTWLRASGTAAMLRWFDEVSRPERRPEPLDRPAME